MIDTHTHIYLTEFDNDRDDVVLRAREAGITKVILPNVDLTTIRSLDEAVNRYTGFCFPAMGLHPTSVDSNYKKALDHIAKLLDTSEYCAIGEIGLDLYWDKTFIAEQIDALTQQMRWASSKKLPVIIHSGTPDDVSMISEFGDFYFGINGVATFKNVHMEDVVKKIGLHRLLLETDAPYLTPVPFRGKRNEPAYIIYTARRLADIMGISLSELSNQTTYNACRLFGLSTK